MFNSTGDNRIFLTYNKLGITDKNTYTTEKTLVPIPIKFSVSSDFNEKLQKAYIIVKKLIIKRIYRSNYGRHCIDRVSIEGEESLERKEGATKINLCLIELERSNDKSSNDFIKEYQRAVIDKFNNRLENYLKGTVKQSEEYNIKINFGLANLEKNPEIANLYKRYNEEKNTTVADNEKLFFIINDSNEKFSFKTFTEPRSLYEYIMELDSSDYFEDMSFGVNFLLIK